MSLNLPVAELITLARRAGDAILEVYTRDAPLAVDRKADDSPVTQADLAAHHVIVAGLRALRPHIPVVSEEDSASHAGRTAWPRYWLIDPLDGTKEFIARNGEFTVNMALVVDGFPVWGVVHAPVLQTSFWGGAGLGTQSQQGSAALVSCEVAPQTPLRVVASKSHLNDETRAFIAQLGEHELVQAGSSLKLCRVAQGLADLYPRLSPTCEWDTAAAQAVVEGAGGWVTDLFGQRLRCSKAELLNPSFVASATAPGVWWSPTAG